MPDSSAKVTLRQSSIQKFFSQKPANASPQGPPPPPPPPPVPLAHGANAECHESTVLTASRGKRKQRDSNLQPPPSKGHPNPIAELPMTDYEREREENIRRNNECLQKLGIIAAAEQLRKLPPPPPARPKFKSPPPQSVPLRRSSRKRVSADSPANPEVETAVETFPPTEYDDSSVLKYMCSAPFAEAAAAAAAAASNSTSRLVGFRRVGAELADPSLARIYTVDVAYLDGGGRALLAAGGHGGRISVYGAAIPSAGVDEEVLGGREEPLMTWSGSRSWISGVRFPKKDSGLLLSSSNDGGLVVWDITKVSSKGLGAGGSACPPVVAEARDLHCKGIFALDELYGLIATASKDSSVGFSRLGSAGIEAERTIAGHHSGPVRGICFRDSDILADCGADNRICILDVRLPNSCSLTIESDHKTGANMVEWSPSQEFLLLSASKDPELLLYDIRSPGQSLHKLQGHTDPNHGKPLQIYKPAFVGSGMTVATPGQGSRQISLYDASTGKAISRGFVGYDATLVMCSVNEKTSTQQMWMAGKQIIQLYPIWQVDADVPERD